MSATEVTRPPKPKGIARWSLTTRRDSQAFQASVDRACERAECQGLDRTLVEEALWRRIEDGYRALVEGWVPSADLSRWLDEVRK